MYRLGSSISHSLQQGNGSPSFYSHRENQLPNGGDLQLDLLHHGGGARSATADAELQKKLDQMMSGTQQLLLAQQATTQRLDESITKVASEVENLQSDVKKISQEIEHTGSAGKRKSRRKVPPELRVKLSVTHHAQKLQFSLV